MFPGTLAPYSSSNTAMDYAPGKGDPGRTILLDEGTSFVVDGHPTVSNYLKFFPNGVPFVYYPNYELSGSGPGGCWSNDLNPTGFANGGVIGGENYTCTITFTEIAKDNIPDDPGGPGNPGGPGPNSSSTATLIVIKNVKNDNGGSRVSSDFAMTVTGTQPSLTLFPGSSTGTIITLQPGSYSVNEVDTFGYIKTLGADCSGLISAGQTKTCIVTNDDAGSGGGGGGGGGGGTVNIPVSDSTSTGSSPQIPPVSGDNPTPPGQVLGATDENSDATGTVQLPRTGMGLVGFLPSLFLGVGIYARRKRS